MHFCSVEVLGRCEVARHLGVPPLQPATSVLGRVLLGGVLQSFVLNVLMSSVLAVGEDFHLYIGSLL